MNEFVKNDVLVAIGNEKGPLWIVDEVLGDGYVVASFWDGKVHVRGVWMSSRVAHKGLIKVDEWDDANKKMKNVEDI